MELRKEVGVMRVEMMALGDRLREHAARTAQDLRDVEPPREAVATGIGALALVAALVALAVRRFARG